MQQAYAQANDIVTAATEQAQEILDNATNDANDIRIGAMQYTDDNYDRTWKILSGILWTATQQNTMVL